MNLNLGNISTKTTKSIKHKDMKEKVKNLIIKVFKNMIIPFSRVFNENNNK